jgi:hypothetical protein
MTPQQRTALEAVAGRALAPAEIAAIEPLLDPDNRNDVAIAAILSLRADGKPRVRIAQPTLIGHGTLADKVGLPGGPLFVRSLRLMAAAPWPEGATQEQQVMKATIEQAWMLLERGNLDVGLTSVRSSLAGMVGKLEGLTQAGVDALLAVAEVPDLVDVNALSRALNVAEGRMNLGG